MARSWSSATAPSAVTPPAPRWAWARTYSCLAGTQPEAELRRAVSEDVTFVLSNAENIALHVRDADLLVGAVLRRGGRAPQVVTEAMVQSMQPGSVIVDVSIDQGGCVATARPTSHSAPVYTEHGVIHYCVPNMPGAYPRTATIALADLAESEWSARRRLNSHRLVRRRCAISPPGLPPTARAQH